MVGPGKDQRIELARELSEEHQDLSLLEQTGSATALAGGFVTAPDALELGAVSQPITLLSRNGEQTLIVNPLESSDAFQTLEQLQVDGYEIELVRAHDQLVARIFERGAEDEYPTYIANAVQPLSNPVEVSAEEINSFVSNITASIEDAHVSGQEPLLYMGVDESGAPMIIVPEDGGWYKMVKQILQDHYDVQPDGEDYLVTNLETGSTFKLDTSAQVMHQPEGRFVIPHNEHGVAPEFYEFQIIEKYKHEATYREVADIIADGAKVCVGGERGELLAIEYNETRFVWNRLTDETYEEFIEKPLDVPGGPNHSSDVIAGYHRLINIRDMLQQSSRGAQLGTLEFGAMLVADDKIGALLQKMKPAIASELAEESITVLSDRFVVGEEELPFDEVLMNHAALKDRFGSQTARLMITAANQELIEELLSNPPTEKEIRIAREKFHSGEPLDPKSTLAVLIYPDTENMSLQNMAEMEQVRRDFHGMLGNTFSRMLITYSQFLQNHERT